MIVEPGGAGAAAAAQRGRGPGVFADRIAGCHCPSLCALFSQRLNTWRRTDPRFRTPLTAGRVPAVAMRLAACIFVLLVVTHGAEASAPGLRAAGMAATPTVAAASTECPCRVRVDTCWSFRLAHLQGRPARRALAEQQDLAAPVAAPGPEAGLAAPAPAPAGPCADDVAPGADDVALDVSEGSMAMVLQSNCMKFCVEGKCSESFPTNSPEWIKCTQDVMGPIWNDCQIGACDHR